MFTIVAAKAPKQVGLRSNNQKTNYIHVHITNWL